MTWFEREIQNITNLWNWTKSNHIDLDNDPSLDLLFDFIKDGPSAPSWSADPEQTKQFEYMFSGLRFYGDWLRMRDSYRYMEDYLTNTGQTWADMMYPSLAGRSGSAGRLVSDAINFTSKNLEKFYH